MGGLQLGLLALAVLATACTSVAKDSSDPALSPEQAAAQYQLATGDKIHVTVFGQADMSGDFTVDSAGDIPEIHVTLVGIEINRSLQIADAGLGFIVFDFETRCCRHHNGVMDKGQISRIIVKYPEEAAVFLDTVVIGFDADLRT